MTDEDLIASLPPGPTGRLPTDRIVVLRSEHVGDDRVDVYRDDVLIETHGVRADFPWSSYYDPATGLLLGSDGTLPVPDAILTDDTEGAPWTTRWEFLDYTGERIERIVEFRPDGVTEDWHLSWDGEVWARYAWDAGDAYEWRHWGEQYASDGTVHARFIINDDLLEQFSQYAGDTPDDQTRAYVDFGGTYEWIVVQDTIEDGALRKRRVDYHAGVWTEETFDAEGRRTAWFAQGPNGESGDWYGDSGWPETSWGDVEDAHDWDVLIHRQDPATGTTQTIVEYDDGRMAGIVDGTVDPRSGDPRPDQVSGWHYDPLQRDGWEYVEISLDPATGDVSSWEFEMSDGTSVVVRAVGGTPAVVYALDVRDAHPWEQRQIELDAQGRYTLERTLLDDGMTVLDEYIEGELARWTWKSGADAEEHLLSSWSRNPDGLDTSESVQVDPDGVRQRIIWAPDPNVAEVDMAVAVEWQDDGDAHDWDYHAVSFDAETGAPTLWSLIFDDGVEEVRSFDGAAHVQTLWTDHDDAQAWTRKWVTFDPETGKRTSSAIVLDDGATIVDSFDFGLPGPAPSDVPSFSGLSIPVLQDIPIPLHALPDLPTIPEVPLPDFDEADLADAASQFDDVYYYCGVV